MPQLYIIAGCNGSGKTTASNTLLPEILNCDEFINADYIAAGISPFNSQAVSIEAGKIMLSRINLLLNERIDFAFETTLATRSFVSLISKAKKLGYEINMIFFWLDSPELAKLRVESRVLKGGHNVADEVITRRYFRGINNLIDLYIKELDKWSVFDNSNENIEIIAEGSSKNKTAIFNYKKWERLLKIAGYER